MLEGRLENGKPLLIWTLGDANGFAERLMADASFITEEKKLEIKEKYQRLRFEPEKKPKDSSVLRTINIKRTPNNDAKPDVSREELKKISDTIYD